MLLFVVPPIPCLQSVLTPVTELCNEIFKYRCIRPEAKGAFEIGNVDSSDQIAQLDFLLLFGVGNDR